MRLGRATLTRMNVTFAMFADAANLSQEGKLNILGVFDALQVATLPTVAPASEPCCASQRRADGVRHAHRVVALAQSDRR